MNSDISHILFTEEQIREKVSEMGKRISADYSGREIILVGILKGAVIFLSDLARCIDRPVPIDFMSVSSYGSETKSSGVVQIIKDIEFSVENKHLLLVEDIVDTGLTLKYLLETIKARRPASVKTCALLDKPEAREVNVTIDYKGFDVPDEFVVGYGLDFDQKYRNLPYIGVLKREIYN